MRYRDERGVRIEGVYNRTDDFVSTRHITAFADSVGDAVDWVHKTPAKWSSNSSTSHCGGETWDLSAGFEGALKLAKDGWQEGIDMIDEALSALIPATGRAGRWGYAQTGGSVSIGRYLTGHPKNMRSRTKRVMGTAPVLHIIVNSVASCAVHGKQMANYGAAITGLIDALENRGRRIHLDAVFVTCAADDVRLSVGWNVKRSSEPVGLSEIAFSLAHPAALRRIGFALMERVSADAQTPGYGLSADAMLCDVPDSTDGTMVIDGISHEPSRCNTPKDALRLAIEQINKAAVIAGHATLHEPLIDEDDYLSDLAEVA